MPVIPLLPLFHKFNSQYFENSLTVNNQPLVKVRWSDNRLKTTAGFYKRKRINGFVDSEIILSKPILSKLSTSEINSTLCHEMIHAWVDRILKKNEIHGPNFLEKMNEINAKEMNFQISIREVSHSSIPNKESTNLRILNPRRSSTSNSNRPYIELVISNWDENWTDGEPRLWSFHRRKN